LFQKLNKFSEVTFVYALDKTKMESSSPWSGRWCSTGVCSPSRIGHTAHQQGSAWWGGVVGWDGVGWWGGMGWSGMGWGVGVGRHKQRKSCIAF